MNPQTAKQINAPQVGELELATRPVLPPSIHPLTILGKAVDAGITKENIEVVKELRQMVKEERADVAKAAFARAFLALRRDMPELYADKQAKHDGRVVYTYCSEEEIANMLDPHLLSHGFTMIPGQTAENGMVTVNITLIHEEGHEIIRGYTVHAGSPNKMKDATACDTGATTSAWRHLVTKMFGLKSRIKDSDDARNLGNKITAEQAENLRQRVRATGSDEESFLKLAGAQTYEEIHVAKFSILDAMIQRREDTRKK